ncbi:MAG: CopD family protein [Dyella sp.]
MLYVWIKIFHLLFVIAWMATVFYLPRILVNIAEAGAEPAVKHRLELMGRRLYRFGHSMFGLAVLFGLLLWQGWRFLAMPDVVGGGHWMHAKLTLVVLLLAYFIWNGRLLKRSIRGEVLPTGRSLRWLNELPVLMLLAVIYLVIAKPF